MPRRELAWLLALTPGGCTTEDVTVLPAVEVPVEPEIEPPAVGSSVVEPLVEVEPPVEASVVEPVIDVVDSLPLFGQPADKIRPARRTRLGRR